MKTVYQMTAYEWRGESKDAAREYLVEVCNENNRVINPVRLELVELDENGDSIKALVAWEATAYVESEAGDFIAPNHPDNGDDAEYGVRIVAASLR